MPTRAVTVRERGLCRPFLLLDPVKCVKAIRGRVEPACKFPLAAVAAAKVLHDGNKALFNWVGLWRQAINSVGISTRSCAASMGHCER